MPFYQMQLAIQKGKNHEFEECVRSLSGKIQRETGCLDCGGFKDVEGGTRYWVYSDWSSTAAMNDHFQALTFEVLLGAVTTLGTLIDFRIADILEKGGLDLARSKLALPPGQGIDTCNTRNIDR